MHMLQQTERICVICVRALEHISDYRPALIGLTVSP